MHTYRENEDGTYDVVFATSSFGRMSVKAMIKDCTFEMAMWYVNILNGGSGRYDKESEKAPKGSYKEG